MSDDSIIIYTDGACRGNPGPGGWGVLMQFQDNEKELYGGEAQTTNNRMELTAAIQGLLALTSKAHPVQLFTDSEYVKNGITQWMTGWKQRGWKTAAKKPVKNQDLWQQLDAIANDYDIEWCWVKGHSGHPGNERADALANQGIDELTSAV